ncbi:hypothetical protein FNV43_RR06782 [Rhamnella rubrinervis]|uniref:ABC transporter domain-containing protein n=1 Tax=Rhamnella rubrinervis TaxID=2594499 RepID=A0A8K0HEK2_9ROSA|nr:hypothetical protein FNV43_RR06782 [Rhamnella rubrinervis]
MEGAWKMENPFRSPSGSRREDEEDDLSWSALQKLPTYNRLRTGILQSMVEPDHANNNSNQPKLVDVLKLNADDRKQFIHRNFNASEQDNEKFLKKLKQRIERVKMPLPSVEVRFEELGIEANCYVGNRALPTLLNSARNLAESCVGLCGVGMAKKTKLKILKNVSGILKPSRMTLLLGPPSSGKTTLLIALAGMLDPSLKAARFQGVGCRYDLLTEITKRERDTGVFPEAEIDLFMKAVAMEEAKGGLITDYILKLLGLDIRADTFVGDDMTRGISGGQKKRVTTGEMIVGPSKTLFVDEISTGLDSSTTLQIVKCMQQLAHLTEATILMSLLQPDPETFDLFDDILLLSEGQIVYQGPREHVLQFFESCGFKCPERKGTADFLQEVTSKKDQEQYRVHKNKPYRFVSVTEFVNSFKAYHVGLQLQIDLSTPYDKSKSHESALALSEYTIPKMHLLKTSIDREWLLIKRTAPVYIFKTVQIIIVDVIASTVFLRTTLHIKYQDGTPFVGAIIFAMIVNMFNGFAELSLAIMRLPVFYKQRNLLFYPAWAFTVPNFLLRVPISVLESLVWTVMTYYTIGYAPEASGFGKHLLIVFLIQQMAAGLSRLMAGVCRTMIVANTGGALSLTNSSMVVMGILAFPTFNALCINELLSPRWMDKLAPGNISKLGVAVLEIFDVPNNVNWYWIGVAGLLGYTFLYNILFTISLRYLNAPSDRQAIMSEDIIQEETTEALTNVDRNQTDAAVSEETDTAADGASRQRGMVLPFTPLAMSFDSVNYYVDMPSEMKDQGVTDNKLQLLQEVTGSFRPGVLTALMGVSGAGKTTLMAVLAGRKTGGYIEGDIRISGFPKKQETFARISGYCEQADIHSPQVTVRESLMYSAFQRLPKEVGEKEKMHFVDEVMELVELDNLKNAIVGLPGISGLSTEQRKRLTIAVELVSNPSIIFMDEPTSGLDASAAAIVMRTVRNTVDTGRTVVCTIHQPSIDIFEAFDELFLMKRRGQVIYPGPLGRNSHKIVEYFEAVPGVTKIREGQNPAAWMPLKFDLELISLSSTSPHPCIKVVDLLGSPDYNLVRYFFTFAAALVVGTIFWQVVSTSSVFRDNSTDLNTIIGAMYLAVLFIGINNCSTVQPIVAVERTVFYRERAAGMYAALPHAIAQVIVEIPYIFVQTAYYSLIVFAMVSFQWTTAKFFWFFFISFFSFLYFTYYGMMTVSITPNHQAAAIFASAFYALFTLFSGFFIPKPIIPKWWSWYYYICPVAWTVYGLIVTQYGDIEDTIKVAGMTPDPTIEWYVENHYGYDMNFMWPTAAILVGFAVFFALMVAVGIKVLSFQTR